MTDISSLSELRQRVPGAFTVPPRVRMMRYAGAIALILPLLAGNANDLKGLDRTKPVGVMMFLEPGLPPRPMPVLYMPASSADEFIKTAALGKMNFEKVSENRYDVTMPRGQQKQPLFRWQQFARARISAAHRRTLAFDSRRRAHAPTPREHNATIVRPAGSLTPIRMASPSRRTHARFADDANEPFPLFVARIPW